MPISLKGKKKVSVSLTNDYKKKVQTKKTPELTDAEIILNSQVTKMPGLQHDLRVTLRCVQMKLKTWEEMLTFA
jgi:hypothetical protein